MQPPASRNAPCPCGSGRRCKECHGALGPIAPAEPDPRLAAALAAQQAGRLEEAAAGYEAVLADSPDEFDALPMLGVVYFQRRQFERALTLIDRALGIRPGNPAAKLNRGRDLKLAGHREPELVLDRFFAALDHHPWLTPEARPAFVAHVRALGLGGHLRVPS